MNDTREPLATAFAAFRTEASDEIRPPGTTSARHVVARRRRTRVGGLAVLVALGLAGAGYLATGLDPTDVPDQAAATPGPTPGAEALQQLAVEALAQLGRTPGDNRPGVVFGPLDRASGSFRYELGSAAEPFPAGDYDLHAACLGGGRAMASWTAGGQLEGATISCDGTVHTVVFRMPAPGTIALNVTPDAVATDRAAIALAVTDPLQIKAVDALGADPTGLRAAGEGFAGADRRDVDRAWYAPGEYVLQLACAGRGNLEVSFTIGRDTESAAVACEETGAMRDIPLTVTSDGDAVTVTIEPDAAALGRAGYAYRVLSR